MDRTDVGPQELCDGMGVGRTEHGLDMWMHADACGYMQMHEDAWDAWDAWDGWPWQAGTREWRETRARWQASVGECRRVQDGQLS